MLGLDENGIAGMCFWILNQSVNRINFNACNMFNHLKLITIANRWNDNSFFYSDIYIYIYIPQALSAFMISKTHIITVALECNNFSSQLDSQFDLQVLKLDL